jgi:TorA maturation chaperone TorD
MRDQGLETALRVAGGVVVLARDLGISQPAVSAWRRVPADRVLAIETITGVSRSILRPDLYPPSDDARREGPMSDAAVQPDDADLARAHQYGLLAVLLGREPGVDTLAAVAGLTGDPSPLGLTHIALAEAASETDATTAAREYFRLFVGVGRGEFLPYASYYLTGFVHERPLARVREDLARLGIARAGTVHEPEDHIAILCEIMAGLAAGRFGDGLATQKHFFERHIEPWAGRFFADLEAVADAPFYARVGAVGRTFLEIEARAFDLDD